MRPLALALAMLAASAALAQPADVRVPGTRVVLKPPPGFRLADQFAGLQHDGSGVALMVTELADAPFDETTAGMTADRLAEQGFEDVTRRDGEFRGRRAVWLTGVQVLRGARYAKRILVVEEPDAVVMLVVNAPPESPSAVADAAWAAARAYRRGDAGPLDPFDGLPFTFAPPDGLSEPLRLGGGLVFGAPGEHGSRRPVFVASLGAAPVLTDLGHYARRRVEQTATVRDIEVTADRPVQIDGRPGHEVLAAALDVETGEPVVVYLVLVPDVPTDAGYVIVQGLGPEGEGWAERFRAATATLRWRE